MIAVHSFSVWPPSPQTLIFSVMIAAPAVVFLTARSCRFIDIEQVKAPLAEHFADMRVLSSIADRRLEHRMEFIGPRQHGNG
ncbi:MAG: hypothetical protein C4523_13035 [Myxococcales bacterium]|nr:MAG: hypothetical protein C4523_13035 [Myxococcales bacterium]